MTYSADYTAGFNDGVMAGKHGAFATDAARAIDELCEAFGLHPDNPEDVVGGIMRYVATLERRLWRANPAGGES